MRLRGTKIHVKSETESRKIQKELFDRGFIWTHMGKLKNEPANCHRKYLQMPESGNLLCTDEETIFYEWKETEITLKDIFPEEIYTSTTVDTGFIWRGTPQSFTSYVTNTSFTNIPSECNHPRYRPATEEEKAWLIACEEAGEFVPREFQIGDNVKGYTNNFKKDTFRTGTIISIQGYSDGRTLTLDTGFSIWEEGAKLITNNNNQSKSINYECKEEVNEVQGSNQSIRRILSKGGNRFSSTENQEQHRGSISRNKKRFSFSSTRTY